MNRTRAAILTQELRWAAPFLNIPPGRKPGGIVHSCVERSLVISSHSGGAALSIAAALVVIGAAPSLHGQATLGSATLGGTVRDQSGLATPRAKIVLTDVARGLSRESTTNESGAYIFPNVPAGDHSLQAAKEGFDAREVKNIRLQVGQVVAIDISLKVGQVSTVISVSGEQTTLIETESNAIGTVVDSERVQSLPLNGRNFLQLAPIASGSSEVVGRADVYTAQVGHPSRAVAIAGNMSTTRLATPSTASPPAADGSAKAP